MTNQMPHEQQDGLLLPGLDGTNPLGFLAALGVLSTLATNVEADHIRMRWQALDGTWLPRIYGIGNDLDELLKELVAGFEKFDTAPWELDEKLPFEAERFRDGVMDAVDSSSRLCRDSVDTLASFGSEYIRDDNGSFKDTSLRMVRSGDSAGNGLLAYGRRIQNETTASDLRSTLAGPWTYADEGCALRWDPAEHHGYALQWTNPSKEKTVSIRGANRLALAAMPLLPTIPRQIKVDTVAFGKPSDQQESFTWPIWQFACDINIAKSLLSLAVLQDRQPIVHELHMLGIQAAFRCDRIMTSTYYRNFTPAQRIV